jgi:hypothetical protein
MMVSVERITRELNLSCDINHKQVIMRLSLEKFFSLLAMKSGMTTKFSKKAMY